MKLFQKASIILFICIMSFILISCRYKGYKGKYPELYTVAINSLLWNNGHSYGADFIMDSDILFIEEDSFGRTLFSYQEKYYAGGCLSYSSLIICQKTDNGFVYFYPDYNFISLEKEIYVSKHHEFSNEKIQNLKLLNDWGKEIDINKCVKIEVTNKKLNSVISDEVFNEIFSEAFGNQMKCFSADYLTSDNYGRFICYGVSLANNEFIFLVMLFNPDKTYSYYKPLNYYGYQDELKIFKEQNNWNFPII